MNKILVFFLLSPILLFAQKSTPKHFLEIISTNGVNMRQAPSVDSPRLMAIPFGEKVEIISHSYDLDNLDTAGTYRVYDYGKKMYVEEPITGGWIKGSYKGKVGYIFDAFLFHSGLADYEYPEEIRGLNEDYVILFPHWNCYYHGAYRPEMNWYGIYQTEIGVHIKPVEISFFAIWDAVAMIFSKPDENKDLLFMIGTRDQKESEDLEEVVFAGYDESATQGSANREYRGLLIEKRESGTIENLYFTREGQRQSANFPFRDDDPFYYVSKIHWEGDLDGDGKMDYIIQYGEKTSMILLFLSTAAEEGELLHPVAFYETGFCC